VIEKKPEIPTIIKCLHILLSTAQLEGFSEWKYNAEANNKIKIHAGQGDRKNDHKQDLIISSLIRHLTSRGCDMQWQSLATTIVTIVAVSINKIIDARYTDPSDIPRNALQSMTSLLEYKSARSSVLHSSTNVQHTAYIMNVLRISHQFLTWPLFSYSDVHSQARLPHESN